MEDQGSFPPAAHENLINGAQIFEPEPEHVAQESVSDMECLELIICQKVDAIVRAPEALLSNGACLGNESYLWQRNKTEGA